MTWRQSYWFLLTGIALAVLIGVHFAFEGNFSGVSVGAAAFITAVITGGIALNKAAKAEKKADDVDRRLNGGLEQAAREHMRLAELEAREAGDYVSLMELARDFEQQRNECLDQLTALHRRLDDAGLGRTEPREDGDG